MHGKVPVLHRRVRKAWEDEAQTWKAVCGDKSHARFGEGGWKRVVPRYYQIVLASQSVTRHLAGRLLYTRGRVAGTNSIKE